MITEPWTGVISLSSSLYCFLSLTSTHSKAVHFLRSGSSKIQLMPCMEEQSVQKLLYETRRHASRTYTCNFPSPYQVNEGAKGGLLHLLSVRGVNQLKEKWTEYNQPKRLRRLMSLFISPRGKHVAVATGNQITILSKEDDFQEPCGIFNSCSLCTFSAGAWSEDGDILGIADDTDTLYFIKANGEVVAEITKRHLKISSQIVGIYSNRDLNTQKSFFCRFTVITLDGSLQHIEISYEPSVSFSKKISDHRSRLCNNVCAFDYHHELNLFVAVAYPTIMSLPSSKRSGSCHLTLWRKSANEELEQLCSTQFEGIYFKPKGYKGQLTYPKVLISMEGTFIATLDLTGSFQIFKLDKESFTLCRFVWEKGEDLPDPNNLSKGGRASFIGIMDFSWWSDRIITTVNKSGVVVLIDILDGSKVQEDDPVYFMPVLEKEPTSTGHQFLLGSSSCQENYDSSDVVALDKLQQMEWIIEDALNQIHFSRLHWCLISFSEKSISEMYDVLVSRKRFQDALNFADSHGLDKDEVLKSQWVNSDQGSNEINMVLSKIKDQDFILCECLERIGPTEDAMKSLLAYGLRITDKNRFSEINYHDSRQAWDIRMARLRLLQFRDRLETYLGINMGRFSVQEYSKFRVMPISEAAFALAESGKIGALNLLFKRHPYSLTPSMLEILASIPETVPVQTYGQLLPGRSPPSGVAVREDDWVECDEMIRFINESVNSHDISIQVKTELIVKHSAGFSWPTTNELSKWYKDRAKAMDSLSGQLDNCLSLLDFAIRKGISELQLFHQDVLYLYQIIYADDSDGEICFNMSLVTWQQLTDYEKFKIMLKGVSEENVAKKLHNKAIPFMHERFKVSIVEDVHLCNSANQNKEESFLVRWLKENALENKLDICLSVIEEGCREFQSNAFFKNEVEAVDCALQCIYLSTVTDKWSVMAGILSKLPQLQDGALQAENFERRLRVAEGHIEAGRLLAFYQVPKPLNFFLEPYSDGKNVKQIIRLILSKFIRRQPGRSDSEWANMWRDMQYLREKAFPFLDLEYILVEFCRGLLKAGRFSLARNYLKGTSSVALAPEKAESLVIQAAREYFFSASSLSCSEIWKAKECLNLYPSSGNVKAEADIIEVLTVKLPNLGVTLLPMQFRQIVDPMDIVKMAITSQSGAYLHVDELIEVAKLLGLQSPDDISAVEEAIAREAAVAGDLQLAFDLCLVLVKKGHGYVWDLCAAIARGPALENMDVNARKQLLGFALSHCDGESIGELLHAWKDLDMQGQCETLMMSSGTSASNFSIAGSSVVPLSEKSNPNTLYLKGFVQDFDSGRTDNQDVHLDKVRDVVSIVAKTLAVENDTDWASILTENGKVLSFAAVELPWLLELSKSELDKKFDTGKLYMNVRTHAVVTILSWLARNGFAPRDNLIASLAKSIMEPPVTAEEDIIGCFYLLNLVDAFSGVEIIEEQLRMRKDYREFSSIVNVGMTYSLLHNSAIGTNPAQRRELLQRRFKEKHAPPTSDDVNKIGKVQSSFWREWKIKLDEQKHLTEHSRALEKIIPGVETERFLSGDSTYIQGVVLSLIESVKFEKKGILKDLVKLADIYGLNRTEVLLQYLSVVLVSDVWMNDDITAEITNYKGEIIVTGAETIKTITMIVYPAVDGCNKLRLAYIYNLLSECYTQLDKTEESLQSIHHDQANGNIWLAHYYKVIEKECRNVSFIKNLNFKNIAGLHGLNFECFSNEVYAHIDNDSLSALAKMVEAFVNFFNDALPQDFMSWQDVYKYYILDMLRALETRATTDVGIRTPEYLQGFINKLEQTYDLCRMYIGLLSHSDALGIMKQYFAAILSLNSSYRNLPDDSAWQDCLIILLNFWMKLTEEMKEIVVEGNTGVTMSFNPECLMSCLKVLMRLVMEDVISPSQGWGTLFDYANSGLSGGLAVEIYNFCRAMVFSGCGFGAVAEVFSLVSSEYLTGSASDCSTGSQSLPRFYLDIMEPILHDLISGSHENQKLCHILSSLSKLEGDVKIMKCVRHVIWERMVRFSDDLQLPSSLRVYVLELLQFISSKNIKGFSDDIQANVVPWEEWDELLYASRKNKTDVDEGILDQKDSSSRFTNTLVALKSSQLVASISPSIEITPDDLLNVDSAVSCFRRLCSEASTDIHFDALLAILEEWDGLFSPGRDGEATAQVSEGNDWNNDDWDEGWESLEDVENVAKERKEDPISVHPLHACWTEIFKKLISQSSISDVMRLIDRSLVKSHGILLDEDEAKSLSQIVLDMDCFNALKMTLLLPYKTLQSQCLGAVEHNLKQGIPRKHSGDHDFLILVLSSGIITSIITDSTYGATLSYVCYLIGSLSHQCQAALLSGHAQNGIKSNNDNGNELLLFRRILFPNLISELVKAGQHVLAGFLLTRFMHTNASFSLINVVDASLIRYLERQLQLLQANEFPVEKTCNTLENTIGGLRGKLSNLIRSTLSLLRAR